jgi:hypothetical protein
MRPSINETASREGAAEMVSTWQQRLGLEAVRVRTQRIHPMQVTGPDGRPGADMVGVVGAEGAFTIVHTRVLRQDDIVHELLHVLRPDWAHPLVEAWTRLLLIAPRLARLLADERRELTIQALPVAPDALTLGEGGTPMNEITAYNLRTRQKVTVLRPEVVTLKNGRKAVRGVASDDGKTPVFKMLSEAQARELSAR